jgi:hypothetical protein
MRHAADICGRPLQVGLPDWKSFGILANPGNAFSGPVIATIYKCGTFPTFRDMSPGNWNASNATAVYGGLPQLMDLGQHLAQVQTDIKALLPDPDSAGVANIDWEAWKPNFVDNRYNEYWIYINRSIALVQKQVRVAGGAPPPPHHHSFVVAIGLTFTCIFTIISLSICCPRRLSRGWAWEHFGYVTQHPSWPEQRQVCTATSI